MINTLLNVRSINTVVTLLSAALIGLIFIFTNPENNISFIPLLFFLLFCFLLASSNTATLLAGKKLKKSTIFRRVILIIGLLVVVMLNSTNNINILDIGIVLLIALGMYFYISRRT